MSNPVPFCNLFFDYFSGEIVWKEIGRTECAASCPNIEFKRLISLDYAFSKNHELNLIVYEIQDPSCFEQDKERNIDLTKGKYLGETIISVHELVSKTNMKIRLLYKSKGLEKELKGIIQISINKADPINDDVINFVIGSNIYINIAHELIKSGRIFFVISKNVEPQEWVVVKRSEKKPKGLKEDVKWDKFSERSESVV